MFNFFKKQRDSSSIISLDIGTEFVKALFVDINENKGEIIGKGEVRQGLSDIQYGAVMDIGAVISNCQEAIREAEVSAKKHARQLIMGISGELVKGMTISMVYKRDYPEEKINMDELKNIVHKVQWKAFDQVRNRISRETGYPEIDMKLVNAAVVDMRIDSYKVLNPLGFQGKEVKISVFNAFAPLVHYGALETIAAELNHLDLIAILSQPYAISRCLEFEEPGNFSGIFIDIGGGTTDIAVVSNGSLEGTEMFAMGGRTFTKRIATELSISFYEAEKIKLAYSDGTLDKNDNERIKDIIENDTDVWLSGIELALSEFEHLDMLPSKIYICGGGASLPEIKQVLQSRGWIKSLPFPKPPLVKFISPKDVNMITDKTNKLNSHIYIPPLALANSALELAGDDTPLTSLLKRVIGMIKV